MHEAPREALQFAREFQARIPFIGHLGIVTESLGAGSCQLSFDMRPELANSFGGAHGGIVMSLLDIAATTATRTLHPGSRGVVTIDLSASFLEAAKGRLIAKARVLRDGRSAVFVESEVHNEDGSLAAKALATTRALEA